MFKLVVFDLDGTLIDSRQDLAQATNRLILEFGGQPLPEDAVVHMVGDGVERLITRAFAAAGLLPVPPPALSRFLELYGGHLLVHTRPYEGVPEAVEALSRVVSLAVLTNKPRELSERILDGLDLSSFFRRVVGGDGPLARKPDPQALLRLIDEFGATIDQTLLVGDSVVDLRTARAAGTPLVLARYGFGFRDVPREQVRADDFVVDSPRDVVRLVRRR